MSVRPRALGVWDHWANITEGWGPIKPYHWRAADRTAELAVLTYPCKNCGARLWKGVDGVWRHRKTGLARCVGDRGTYAEPQQRRRAA